MTSGEIKEELKYSSLPCIYFSHFRRFEDHHGPRDWSKLYLKAFAAVEMDEGTMGSDPYFNERKEMSLSCVVRSLQAT